MKMNGIHEKPLSRLYEIIQSGISKCSIEQLSELEVVYSYNEVIEKFLTGGYPFPVLRRDPRVGSLFEAFVIEEILQGMWAGMGTWQAH